MPTAPFTVFAFTIFALLATAARAQGQAAKPVVHTGTILFKRHPSLMVQHESNITVGDDSFGCNFDGANADCSSNYIQGFDELPVVTLEGGDDLASTAPAFCRPAVKTCGDPLNVPPSEKEWNCPAKKGPYDPEPDCTATRQFTYRFMTITIPYEHRAGKHRVKFVVVNDTMYIAN